MTGIHVDGLAVSLGRKQILGEISFDAKPSQVTAVVGPNGSGKSNLLKALTGEISSRGTAMLNGQDIQTARPETLADIRAVLPQATPMSFPFQVQEVVRLGLRFRVPGSDAVARDALRKVGLSGYGTRLYQELSGGEQQRAQLARVLCQVWSPHPAEAPRWLFLDEPVASLDIAHQLHVMQIARDFANDGGGVLVVMHDLNLSAMFADTVLVLKGGRLAAFGPTKPTLTNALLSNVYGCDVFTCATPTQEDWFMLPHLSRTAQKHFL